MDCSQEQLLVSESYKKKSNKFSSCQRSTSPLFLCCFLCSVLSRSCQMIMFVTSVYFSCPPFYWTLKLELQPQNFGILVTSLASFARKQCVKQIKLVQFLNCRQRMLQVFRSFFFLLLLTCLLPVRLRVLGAGKNEWSFRHGRVQQWTHTFVLHNSDVYTDA